MTTTDALLYMLNSTEQMVLRYLSDWTDADLLVRPVPGANHAAWQLGHLIGSEAGYFQTKMPGTTPFPLPAGFAEQHGKDTAAQDPPTGFKTKAEYIALFQQVRAVSKEALKKCTDADLDVPSGWDMAPTLGAVFITISSHDLMHAGQFTVVRRKLGKPVLF